MAQARYNTTYLNALKSILKENLEDRPFSIFQNPQEESVCLNWIDNSEVFLEVFLYQRGQKRNVKICDTMLEACVSFLSLAASGDLRDKLQREFILKATVEIPDEDKKRN